MNVEISLSDHSILEFTPGLPLSYRGPILFGAQTVSVKTNIAEAVLQKLVGQNYFIRLSTGRLLQKFTVKSRGSEFGLYSNFILKNEARKEINRLGKFHLRKNQFISFFSESINCKVRFEKNEEFKILDIFYSPKLLQELVPYFPELKQLLKDCPNTVLGNKGIWSAPTMIEIINQILNCPYNETTRQFYYDIKVRELLYQLLEISFKKSQDAHHFTAFETARIHDARTILEQHIDKAPPSIRSLAKQVAINEYKLKTGFRKYFNSGIIEWLSEQKMLQAKHLILTTNKPVKEICSLVGYPRSTNFITAFRRRFGITPGSLRRDKY